jgi:hypothetical protein
MSRKNSRSDSIEIFINRRRTSSSSSSIGNNECKRSNSIDSRSMSIGSIESIIMEEKDNICVKTNKNKNKKQIAINKETIRRTRDVYYELELQPSPNPLYLTHLTYTPWEDNESTTKK